MSPFKPFAAAGLALAAMALSPAWSAPAAAAPDAAAMRALARASGCLACHAIDRRRVAPSYQAIASRFAGRPGALRTLENAILNGNSGTWGVIPMPAYGGAQQLLTASQAEQLARWVLSLAPAAPPPRKSAPAN